VLTLRTNWFLLSTQVTREVFQAAKGRLKVVGRAGVGIDNVDLAAATEYGVLVVNAPTANTIAAAEHGIALLCSMSRNVAQADASMKVCPPEIMTLRYRRL
jgi:D-3-phosphoglycerate dehydrogenase